MCWAMDDKDANGGDGGKKVPSHGFVLPFPGIGGNHKEQKLLHVLVETNAQDILGAVFYA